MLSKGRKPQKRARRARRSVGSLVDALEARRLLAGVAATLAAPAQGIVGFEYDVTFPTLHDAHGILSRNMITSAAAVGGDPAPITGTALPHDHAIAGAAYVASLAQFDPIPWAVSGNPGSDTPSVTLDWGDGSQPEVLTNVTTGGPYTVIGGHTFTKPGTYDVTLSLFERTDLRATVHTQVIVDPTSPGGQMLSLTTGQRFSGLVATYIGKTPSYLPPGAFPAVIDWGDGHKSAGTVTSTGGSHFQVDARHTYANPGEYAIAVNVVQDPPPDPTGTLPIYLGSGITIHSRAEVTGAAVAQPPPAGVVVSALPQQAGVTTEMFVNTLAKLTGLSPEDAIPDVEIHYLDGQHINYGTGINVEEKTAEWDGTGFTTNASADYVEGGTYHIEVTFKSGDVAYGTVDVAVPIDQNPPGGVTINAVAGAPFTGVVATLTDTHYHRAPDAITIDWGDNTDRATPTVTPLGNDQYQASGTHTYTQAGEYRLTIFALYHVNPQMDDESLFVRSTAEVSADPPIPSAVLPAKSGWTSFTGVAGDPIWENLATFDAGSNAAGLTAIVRWGDRTRAMPAQILDDAGRVTANAQHVYAKAGNFTAVILFKRAGKTLARMRDRISIARNSPGGLDLLASAGRSFTAPVGTLYSPAGVPPRMVEIDWGDGSVTQGTVADGTVAAVDATHFKVTASHTYAKRGRYRIKVSDNNYPDPQNAAAFDVINSTIMVKATRFIR